MKCAWLALFAVVIGGCGGTSGAPNDQYKEAVRRIAILSRSGQLYSSDNDDVFMLASNWNQSLEPYIATYPGDSSHAFVSPMFDGQPGKFGFAYNPVVAGNYFNGIPEGTLAFYDSSNTAEGAVADPSTIPSPPRYSGGNAIAYANGDVPNSTFPPDQTPVQASASRLKQVSLAALMYAADNDDILPPAAWNDAIQPYTRSHEIFISPIFDGTGNYGYAFNQDAVSARITTLENPSQFITFFDSTLLQRQAVGPTSTLPSPGRYEGQNTISHADGSVSPYVPDWWR